MTTKPNDVLRWRRRMSLEISDSFLRRRIKTNTNNIKSNPHPPPTAPAMIGKEDAPRDSDAETEAENQAGKKDKPHGHTKGPDEKVKPQGHTTWPEV